MNQNKFKSNKNIKPSRKHLHKKQPKTDRPSSPKQEPKIKRFLGIVLWHKINLLNLPLLPPLLPRQQLLLPLDIIKRNHQVINTLHIHLIRRLESLKHGDLRYIKHKHSYLLLSLAYFYCFDLVLWSIEVEMNIPVVKDDDVEEFLFVVQDNLLELLVLPVEELVAELGYQCLDVRWYFFYPRHLHPNLDVHIHQLPSLQHPLLLPPRAMHQLHRYGKNPRANRE